MKFGDFFSTSPYSRPVNAKPFLFTAVSRRPILPGGKRNPTEGGTVAAVCRAAFVFLGGDVSGEARHAARDVVEARRKDKDGTIKPFDGLDVGHELTYQLLARVLYQWDEKSGRALDEPLFESVDLARECIVPKEADRIMKAYDEYVAKEHPEVIDDATFRGAPAASAGASSG